MARRGQIYRKVVKHINYDNLLFTTDDRRTYIRVRGVFNETSFPAMKAAITRIVNLWKFIQVLYINAPVQ